MYLKEGSMREWKGWDVLEGKFNEKMERLGVLEEKFNEVMERLDILGKVQKEDGTEGVEEGRMKEGSMRKNGKVGVYLREGSVRKWKG